MPNFGHAESRACSGWYQIEITAVASPGLIGVSEPGEGERLRIPCNYTTWPTVHATWECSGISYNESRRRARERLAAYFKAHWGDGINNGLGQIPAECLPVSGVFNYAARIGATPLRR